MNWGGHTSIATGNGEGKGGCGWPIPFMGWTVGYIELDILVGDALSTEKPPRKGWGWGCGQ